MRNMALGTLAAGVAGTVVASGIALAAITPASAGPLGGATMRGAPAPAAERVQYRSGRCDELRRACLYKSELGERGLGNCQRYRAECRSVSGYLPSRAYRPYIEYREYRPAYRAYRPTYWRHPYWD
jgi:hypothetical protein